LAIRRGKERKFFSEKKKEKRMTFFCFNFRT
jgi:hypothetical protein